MEYAIEVESVVKKFGELAAVNNVSFQVEKSTVFGLLGSNGAGKTTTINMLTGLLLLDSGSMKVLGMDVSKEIEKIRKHIALVPQTISLYEDLTIYENLEFFGGLYISTEKELKENIEEILEVLRLQDKKNVRIGQLSGGYKRRCSIGCALVSNPKILFLDEPLTGIDIVTNELIINFIKSIKNTTIIFTTHSIKEAEAICDHVLFMDKGKNILEGVPHEIVKKYSAELGERVIVEFDRKVDVPKIRSHLEEGNFNIRNLKSEGNTISFTSKDLGGSVIEVISKLKPIEEHVLNIDIKKPILEDIFMYVVGSQNETSKNN